ncbi:MAG: hypothetical protein QOF77_660 [Solirubrobacteraceae bacterium]|jgi:hypothetical protein|nr:hypothetical protein [Solirubrobacteraceae bacterium]
MRIVLAGDMLADVRRYLSTTYIAGTEVDDALEIIDPNRPIAADAYRDAWALLRLIDGADLRQGGPEVTLELEDDRLEDLLLDTLAELQRRGR